MHLQNKQLILDLDYLSIDDLVSLIGLENRNQCQTILTHNRDIFERAYGSKANHQAWVGGYIDHITECLNYARHLYALEQAMGRPMCFTLSDALLVLFIHDLEKPWRMTVPDEDGIVYINPVLRTKEERAAFRTELTTMYRIFLTPDQYNAFNCVEGEGKDYSGEYRVMNELAAFCHQVDTWSARHRHDYPKAEGDEWVGAGRFRTTAPKTK